MTGKQTRDIDFVRRRLGHRSAVTTSLYIRGSMDEDRKRLDELRLVREEGDRELKE